MEISEYVYPSLGVLIPILYICGVAIKKSSIKDYKIPFILGIIGIILANIWLFAEKLPTDWHEALTTVLSGTVQGIICAACSVYTNNLVKQHKEGQDEKTHTDN